MRRVLANRESEVSNISVPSTSGAANGATRCRGADEVGLNPMWFFLIWVPTGLGTPPAHADSRGWGALAHTPCVTVNGLVG